MVGVLVQPHQGIRPIRSTGDPGSQFLDCFLHRVDSGLTGIHPYGRKAILSIPCGLLLGIYQEEGDVIAEFFFASPSLEANEGESSNWVTDEI